MRIPKNGMLFMIIVIIVMTGIMIIANTNYQYRATLPYHSHKVGFLLEISKQRSIEKKIVTLWSKLA